MARALREAGFVKGRAIVDDVAMMLVKDPIVRRHKKVNQKTMVSTTCFARRATDLLHVDCCRVYLW